MTSHRMNSNYISEAELMRRQVYRLIGKMMGFGNFLGSLIFALFILVDEGRAPFQDFYIPIGLFFLGLFSFWLDRSTLKEGVRQHLYALNYISIPLIVFYFVDEAAVTSWTIVFLYLIGAFILQNVVLVLYTLISSFFVLAALMFFSPQNIWVQVQTDDHIIRLLLFAMAAILCGFGLLSIIKREKLLFHYMDQSEETAFQDPFLKIPNRIDFNLYVEYALKTSTVIICKVAINNFQTIYDVLGHQKSDELLEMVKQRLSVRLNSFSYLAKAEGSAFLIAFTDVTDKQQVKTNLEEIMDNLVPPYILGQHDYVLNFNIGAACSLTDGSSSDELMRNAQFALARSKESGLNRIAFCSKEIKQSLMNQVQVSEALYQADIEQEFHLVYQPQVELKTNRIIGLEALLRWENPQMGIVSPNIFIDVAEKNGCIVPLGKWILERACQEVQNLSLSVGSPLKLAVNVSFIQIRQEDFVDDVLAIVEKTGFPMNQLEIELTERSLVENRPEDLKKIEKLRSHGIRIAIDDFGTGYSSFGILAKIKVDKIKVPREFIDHIDTNLNSQHIVKTIVSMAELFQITCLAEGIERIEESNFLQQMTCQEGQGYYYAKPAAISRIEKLLATCWLQEISTITGREAKSI